MVSNTIAAHLDPEYYQGLGAVCYGLIMQGFWENHYVHQVHGKNGLIEPMPKSSEVCKVEWR
jgi:hypothetical protein